MYTFKLLFPLVLKSIAIHIQFWNNISHSTQTYWPINTSVCFLRFELHSPVLFINYVFHSTLESYIGEASRSMLLYGVTWHLFHAQNLKSKSNQGWKGWSEAELRDPCSYIAFVFRACSAALCGPWKRGFRHTSLPNGYLTSNVSEVPLSQVLDVKPQLLTPSPTPQTAALNDTTGLELC